MTKDEAKKLGAKAGKDHGTQIWTDVPYERLAQVAEKYRHKKAWTDVDYEPAESKWNKKTERWDVTKTQIPAALRDTFKTAYIQAGIKVIEENIKHAIKTGYLEEA